MTETYTSCPALTPEKWAQESGYSHWVHSFEPTSLDDFYMDPEAIPLWHRETVRYLRRERNTSLVTRAINAKILTQGYIMPNGSLDESFYLFSHDNRMLMESTYWLKYIQHYGVFCGLSHSDEDVWVDFDRAEYLSLDEPVYFLGSRRMWGHWLPDFLPRLQFWQELPNRDLYKLAVGPLTLLQKQTLAICGVRPDQWIELPLEAGKSYVIQCDEIIAPQTPPPRECYKYTRRQFSKWSEELLVDKTLSRPRLYLTRKHLAPTQRVGNEDAVAECLKRRGFQSFVPETLPLEEQLDLLTTAEIIVTPFGSGLANACVSSSDAVFIQFVPVHYWINAEQRLLEDSIYPYWFSTGVPLIPIFADSEDKADDTVNAPLIIDLDVLNSAIDRAEALIR